MINLKKVDAPLAFAISEASPSLSSKLSVFVKFTNKIGESEQEVLSKLGIERSINKDIITVELSLESLDILSNLPWVKYIKSGFKRDLL